MGVGSSGGLNQLCLKRADRSYCGLNDSLFGEDAFYRDAFYDCEEGNKSHDGLFAKAHEQARLKMRKVSVVSNYAAFELKRRSGVSDALKACVKPSESSGKNNREDESARAKWQFLPHIKEVNEADYPCWLSRTMPEWTEPDLPGCGSGPYWGPGTGEGFKVRSGPDYRKSGKKSDSLGSMYQAVTCDAIKGAEKLTDIITKHTKGHLPMPPSFSESDRGGGSPLEWTTDCPLPRIVCINLMLPYTAGMGWRKDAGCSFVGFFHIKPETIKAAQSPDPPGSVRLFKEFWEGPAGKPGGPQDDPDRSLFKRVQPRTKKDQQRGLFKCIAHCINPEDVNVPEWLRTYNGKPCLITKCGYVIKDPMGEWLEIGIDVRGFNLAARNMLCTFRKDLPRTKIHYGFLIQGVEDEDMPEGILCDMFVYGCNMIDDPHFIGDGASTPSSPTREGEASSSTRPTSALRAPQ